MDLRPPDLYKLESTYTITTPHPTDNLWETKHATDAFKERFTKTGAESDRFYCCRESCYRLSNQLLVVCGGVASGCGGGGVKTHRQSRQTVRPSRTVMTASERELEIYLKILLIYRRLQGGERRDCGLVNVCWYYQFCTLIRTVKKGLGWTVGCSWQLRLGLVA